MKAPEARKEMPCAIFYTTRLPRAERMISHAITRSSRHDTFDYLPAQRARKFLLISPMMGQQNKALSIIIEAMIFTRLEPPLLLDYF